ncbi:DNA primase [Dictyobacter arantiisoli]|uniref:DNA primase n=2 Tax=Dictyobacter arantiisoli TaxID=2014874 RepID=A0A5A5T6U0_9CHLR|nr:DNA primase [Dictyobacter arantiisoli]
MDFHEALLHLAEKADVPVEENGSGNAEEERETNALKERLRKLNEDAVLWFHQMLLRSPEAAGAREYVQSRGISADSVQLFSLGYVGDQWDGLTRFLLGQGYSEQELVTGGVARWRESDTLGGERNGIYDYFRNRLMFPIRDERGRVIGFGGRALGDNKPKYLNTPQTILFEKNTVLYGIDMAKDAIRQIGQVVIVEGYVDAVIAQQYGTRQTVACCGSAITEKHIQKLKKLTKQVTLALDPDAAGNAATEQGIKEALKGFDRTIVPVPLAGGSSSGFRQSGQKGKWNGQSKQSEQSQTRGIIRLEEQVDAEINVLQLPPGEDPDEVIRRDFAAWFYAVNHPLSLIDYYFVTRTMDLNLHEPVGQAEAAKRLLPVIGMISGRIKRDVYIRKLASMIGVEERSLYEELQRVLSSQKNTGMTADFSGKGPISSQNGRPTSSGKEETQRAKGDLEEKKYDFPSTEDKKSTKAQTRDRLDRTVQNTLKWEDYLIGLLIQNPGLYPHVCAIINEGDFAGTDTRELYHLLNSVYQRESSPSYQSLEQFVPSALMPAVTRSLKCLEAMSSRDEEALIKEAVQCATRLKKTRLLQLNTELKFLLREAAATGDKAAMRQFQQQFVTIQRQLLTLNTATRLQG